MADLDLNKVAVFIKIVDSKNLTHTARNLGSSKSKISRALSQLESELGVQLIHRSTRHLQLTEIGQRFYEHCKAPLNGLILAANSLQLKQQDLIGKIRITCPQDIGISMLLDSIRDFRLIHPKIDFEIYFSQEALNLIQDSIDLALRIGKLKDSQMKAQKISETSTILVASPKYLESIPKLTSISEISRTICLSFINNTSTWLLKTKNDKKTIRIQSPIKTNHPEFNLQMVLQGQGIGLLPEFICRDHIRSGKLTHLFPEWTGENAPIHLVFPYTGKLPQHIRRFVDFLIPQLKIKFSNQL